MLKIQSKLITVLALAVMLCVLSACGGSGTPGAGQAQPSQASDPAPAADDTSASLAFKSGVWTAYSNGEADSYFVFHEDGRSGSMRSLLSGTGAAFEYEREQPDAAVFHFGAVDDQSPCSVSVSGDGSVTLGFDGYSYTLVYLTEDPDLTWYSNSELEEMALKYYAANNDGYTPGCVGSAVNEDGTVSIQLYDQLEDHNSTCAWYTVDRFTAVGTDDITQGSVDLSGYAE